MARDGGAPLAGARADDVITVVLTADNHLGYDACGRGGLHGRREERLRRLRGALKQATDFAVGQGVDLFIQAGDLFDSPRPTEGDRSFVAARLAELRQAGVRVFAVSGVHDTPSDFGHEDAIAPQVSYAHLGALHYFPPLRPGGALEPVMVDVRGNVLAVCGLSARAGGNDFPFSSSDAKRRGDSRVDELNKSYGTGSLGDSLPFAGVGMSRAEEGDPLAKVHVEGDIERAALSLLIVHAPIEGLASVGTVPPEAVFDSRRSGGLLRPQENAGAGSGIARATLAGQSLFRVVVAGYDHTSFQHVRIGGKSGGLPQTDVIVAGATSLAEGEPGFVFLGLAADGVRWCQHIRTDAALCLRRVVIDTAELWGDGGVDAGGGGPTEMILERLRPLCSASRDGADVAPSVVELRLVGELSRGQYHQVDFGQVRRYGEEHCFELAIDESGLSLLPGDGVGREVWGTSYAGGSRSTQTAMAGSLGDFLGELAISPADHIVPAPPAGEEVPQTSRHVGLPDHLQLPSPLRTGEGNHVGLPRRTGEEFFVQSAMMGERLSPREELVSVADEWIAGASDEQEKRALIATKEELLTALERMRRR